ncbi:unnamed protein product [Linum tenue]|uniref:Disease resistance N-terminal domain-containing protein n=1 Tax=Linum tenue TaxID=586396 RepID=A0AAV0PSC3_9ROSI|nr:unnamed protein product [Linum tenue]
MLDEKVVLDAAKQGAKSLGKAVAPIATQHVKMLFGVNKELDRLRSTVDAIEAVLKDAAAAAGGGGGGGLSYQDGEWVDNLARMRDEAADLLKSYSARKRRHDAILNRRFNCVSLANYAVSVPGYWVENYFAALKVSKIRERLDAMAKDRKTVHSNFR